MSAINFSDEAEMLANELDSDVQASELAAEMQNIQSQFGIPKNEVVRTVADRYTEDDEFEMYDGNETIVIADIEDTHENSDDDGEWVDITPVQVMGTWENDHESIAQKAEIADESGRTIVTVWANDGDEPELEEGETYTLENVPTDEYNGTYSVNITSASEVIPVETDLEPDDGHVEVTGQVVEVKDGSGLIKRCSHEDCSRTLNDGKCAEHGDVEHEFDLRVKAVVDDGETAESVLFGTEETSDLLDVTLEGAIEEATERLNPDYLGDVASEELVGTHLSITGPEFPNQVLVDEWVALEALSSEETNDLLVEARSVSL